MSVVLSKQRNKMTTSLMASGTWNKVFPVDLELRQESLTFVKKLLSVGISSVVYLRANFPEDAFDEVILDKLSLRILNRSSEWEPARRLCDSVAAAVDAVEKTFLRELILAIFLDKDKPEDAVETYTFTFEYKVEESGSTSVKVDLSAKNTKKTKSAVIEEKNTIYRETILLIRKVMSCTQTLEVLPDDAFATIQLTYYDERTPEDYNPPGYGPTDIDFACDQKVTPITTNKVNTRHHAFQVQIRAMEFERRSFDEDDAMREEAKVNCGCEHDVEKASVILTCELCNTLQHGECFLIFDDTQVPESHFCHNCALEKGIKKSTERYLYKYMKAGRSIKPTCLFRRALYFCLMSGNVTEDDFYSYLGNGDSKSVALVLEKLRNEEVLDNDFSINVDKLTKVAAKYLGKSAHKLISEQTGMDASFSSSLVSLEKGSQVSELEKNAKKLSLNENPKPSELKKRVNEHETSESGDNQPKRKKKSELRESGIISI